MLVPLLAITVLIAAIGAIYLILKNMGEDGVEAAAPGSCKSGNCGVHKHSGINTTYHITEAPSNEIGEHLPEDPLTALPKTPLLLNDETKVVAEFVAESNQTR